MGYPHSGLPHQRPAEVSDPSDCPGDVVNHDVVPAAGADLATKNEEVLLSSAWWVFDRRGLNVWQDYFGRNPYDWAGERWRNLGADLASSPVPYNVSGSCNSGGSSLTPGRVQWSICNSWRPG